MITSGFRAPGSMRSPPSPRLDDSALASVSMGYQVGVTPLQMVTATAAVANGGRLLKPRIYGRDRKGLPLEVKP